MKSDFITYDLDRLDVDLNYRWLQPPLIAYFVTTQDSKGNTNITPVTLGTLVSANMPRGDKPAEFYFTFSLGSVDIKDEGNEVPARHGLRNLVQSRECVISYIGYDLKDKSWLTGLPVPRGISEFDIAGLTPLPSSKVTPPGIKECPVNMEAKVEQITPIGSYYTMFLCKIVAANIQSEYVERDKNDNSLMGVAAIDPLFEVDIQRTEKGSIRLLYQRLKRDEILTTSDEVGCEMDWIGTFDKWMDSEVKRGTISSETKRKMLELNNLWLKNPDPVGNGSVKMELTDLIKQITLKNTEEI